MAKGVDVPFLLLPYQQTWYADKSPVKVCVKSRRIGLSWAEACSAVMDASIAGPGGMNVQYLSYSHEMTRQFVKDCEFWIDKFQIIGTEIQEIIVEDKDKDILTYRIGFASGYEIMALPSTPSSIRSKKGRVIIDEAAFVPNLESLLAAAMPLLMWGGKVSIISTFNGVDEPFHKLVREVQAGKWDYSLHIIDFDRAIKDGLYKRISFIEGVNWTEKREARWRQQLIDRSRDPDQEYFCQPKSSESQYLPGILVEQCMKTQYPVFRLTLNATFHQMPKQDRFEYVQNWLDENARPILSSLGAWRASYIGMDFGRVGDISAIAPLVEQDDLIRFTPFMLELRNCPIQQQRQVLWWLISKLPFCQGVGIDAGGNGLTIAEDTQEKFTEDFVLPIKLSDPMYLKIMPRYKQALESRKIELPSDTLVLADHASVVEMNGVPKVPKKRYRAAGADTSDMRHGDTVIALALAWYTATEKAGKGLSESAMQMLEQAGQEISTGRNLARDIFVGATAGPVVAGRGSARGIF